MLASYPDSEYAFYGNVAVSPNSRRLAFVDHGLAVQVADLATGGTTQVAPGLGPPESRRGAMAWSPDGAQLAFVQDGNIHLWRAQAGATQLTSLGSVTDLVFSPDGSRLRLRAA